MPEPTENGRAHLRRAVAELPTHAPDPATWPRIAGQLAIEQAIAAALPYLPTHAPTADAWAAIAARLDASSESVAAAAGAPAPVARPLWPARLGWVAGLAAAVLLLLSVWWLRPNTPTSPLAAAAPHETVTFGEEVAALPGLAPASLTAPADPLAQQGEAFIEAHCTSLPTVCQSGEFRDLRAQLSEVAAQQRRLHQDMRRFGTSPALVREQGQLTTLRAALTRELVQLLIS